MTSTPSDVDTLDTGTFADLGVPSQLISILRDQGITAPFPIQQLTVADALAGHDLCGKAPTGSGKTLAFALPAAMRVKRAEPGRPRGLLLVPTRELAVQVREVLDPLARGMKRTTATFYGGTNINRDLQRLRGRIDVVVATPGRLEDLIDRGAITLADVDLVVLDEADRMADMGFLPVMKRLLVQTRDDRQTLLFSATLDGDVDVLIRGFQRHPVRHEFHSPADEQGDVRHLFWAAERAERRRLTVDVLRRISPAIVFTRTKHGADRLARQLHQDGLKTAAIHGNRSQKQREQALARFSDGRVTTLVATDVAARGIHVDSVAAVVHFDQPATSKDYVHRSGRTGRAGATGLVVSFVGEAETRDVQAMQRDLSLPVGLHQLDLQLLTAVDHPAPIHTDVPGPQRRGDRRAPRKSTRAKGAAPQRRDARPSSRDQASRADGDGRTPASRTGAPRKRARRRAQATGQGSSGRRGQPGRGQGRTNGQGRSVRAGQRSGSSRSRASSR